jgi:hypothetical protein
MKNLLTLLCGILVFASCSKNVEMPNTIEEPVTTKVTNKHKFIAELQISDAMLPFSSTEEMEKTIAELSFMKEDGLMAWYKKTNPDFVSQEMIYRNAVDDLALLENIDEADAFKTKYSPYLLFNNNPADEELYNPYLPNVDFFGLSYVANKDGNVLISGKIVNLNKNVTSVKDTEAYKLKRESFNRVQTKSATIYKNTMYITNTSKGRHLQVNAYRSGASAAVKVYAELKNWLGWHSYNANWSFQYVSHSPTTIATPSNAIGLQTMRSVYPGYYSTPSLPNNTNVGISDTTPSIYGGYNLIDAKFYVWNSGLDKADTGIFHLVI